MFIDGPRLTTPDSRMVVGQQFAAPPVPGIVPQPAPPHCPQLSWQQMSPSWYPGTPLAHVDASAGGQPTVGNQQKLNKHETVEKENQTKPNETKHTHNQQCWTPYREFRVICIGLSTNRIERVSPSIDSTNKYSIRIYMKHTVTVAIYIDRWGAILQG